MLIRFNSKRFSLLLIKLKSTTTDSGRSDDCEQARIDWAGGGMGDGGDQVKCYTV